MIYLFAPVDIIECKNLLYDIIFLPFLITD